MPKIDLLLTEYAALCCLYAHGKKTWEEVQAYRRHILAAITADVAPVVNVLFEQHGPDKILVALAERLRAEEDARQAARRPWMC